MSPDQPIPPQNNPELQNPIQPTPQTQFSPQPTVPIQPIAQQAPQVSPQVHTFDMPVPPTPNNASGGVPPSTPIGATASSQQTNPKPKNKKKILLGVGAGVLLLSVLLGGFVFGYYIPNQPANVWKTSLNRSGKALNQIVNSASEKETITAYEKSEITVTAGVKVEDYDINGNLDVKFGDAKADATMDVSVKNAGEAEQKLNTKLLFELPEGSNYPNSYFKVNGIKALGLDQLSPEVAEFDNKWIAIEADYLKSLGAPTTTSEQVKNEQINSEDISEISKAISEVASEYLFTAEPDKAIFVQKSFVGKENVDAIKTYHYTVGINNENAKKLCAALTEKLYSTNGYRKLTGGNDEEIEKSKKIEIENCKKPGNDFKESDTYDLWVDSKYKLIHKIRFTNKDDTSSYTEVGQNYKGGDEISLFINNKDGASKSTSTFTLDTNLKTRVTIGSIESSSKGEFPYTIKLSMQAKPYTDDIVIQKPSDAIPIEEVLKKFGVDPKETFGPVEGDDTLIEPTPAIYAPLLSRTIDGINFSPAGFKSLGDAVDTSLQNSGISPAINDLFDTSVRGDKIVLESDDSLASIQKITRIALSLLNR